jgi:AraC-like DNA-binding protein
MPHLHASRLYTADGLRLRRVTCDGHDDARVAEECNDDPCVIVVLRGRFVFRDRAITAVASPCTSLFLHDGHAHRIHHIDGEGDVCLSIRGDVSSALVESGPTARPLSAHAYLRAQSVARRLSQGDALSRLALEEMLCESLGTECRRPDRSARKDRAIADTITYTLERDIHALVSLSQVARVAGVSVFRACRAFKRATGTSIHRAHVDIRLRHALALLLDTDLPLAQLALDVGFANQPHFTNVFRRRFRTTPQRVRQSHRLPPDA